MENSVKCFSIWSNADNTNSSLVWTNLVENGTDLFSLTDLQMRVMQGDSAGWGSTPASSNNLGVGDNGCYH